ncbi:MAG: transcriptional regulator [Candidatus Heimdallarchaeota archaeon]|nr:transcriptional regulator [Candidatus Heimdallarchaeota archaeon]
MAKVRSLDDFSIIHLLPRLQIIQQLIELTKLSLFDLMDKTGLTSGNLHSHCKVLINSGYIVKIRNIEANTFRVGYEITQDGISNYNKYVEELTRFLNIKPGGMDISDPNFKYALPPSRFAENLDPEGNQFRFAKF